MYCHNSIIILLLLFLSLLHYSHSIKCVRCQGIECTNLNLRPEQCPQDVKGCLSILTENWVETNRFDINRDCYTKEYAELCTPLHLANQTCEYCDHANGCNAEKKEPLICRHCDYVGGTEGFKCESALVCQPMFRTVAPQCHVSWAGHSDGTHYGCWHQLNRRARLKQLATDQPNLHTKRCDSNSCNSGIDTLFENHTDLLELRRFCYTGKSGRKSLVHCRNFMYKEPIIPFCMFAWSATLSTLRNGDCYSEMYHKTAIQRDVYVDHGDYYFCNSNGCNAGERAPMYSCHGPNKRTYYIFKSSDACVTYNDPIRGYSPLGRLHLNYCSDPRRCLICKSNFCNTKENMARLYCYHTNHKEGLYIRRGQLDYMDMCAKGVKNCFTVYKNNRVWRGCQNSSTPSTASLCNKNLCNNQPFATYCYKCSISDPNCVFSQGNGRQFEYCAPPGIGCFTRIYGDGSASRGCAVKEDDPILDTEYIFCRTPMLCNDKTTKMHSCILYTGLVYSMPEIPSFVERPWRTQEGIAFETCPDELGLPACYTRSYIRDRQAYHQSGCTNEISVSSHIHFRRGFGNTQSDGTIMCDGHYCNRLPLDGSSWIDLDRPSIF